MKKQINKEEVPAHNAAVVVKLIKHLLDPATTIRYQDNRCKGVL